jgi:RNase P/RNase MRP subunit p29
MDKYCDIVPHPDGWTFVLNGVEAECSFHTYELAVEAAKARLARDRRKRVFRFQGLNGEMLPVPGNVLLQGSYIS